MFNLSLVCGYKCKQALAVICQALKTLKGSNLNSPGCNPGCPLRKAPTAKQLNSLLVGDIQPRCGWWEWGCPETPDCIRGYSNLSPPGTLKHEILNLPEKGGEA